MKFTKEEQDKMVHDLIESIDWTRAYQTFVKVKELNECKTISQKSPNQLRLFVTKLAYEVVDNEVEVLNFIETNCIRIEFVEEDLLELTFTVHAPMEVSHYDIAKIQEFLPEDFKQPYDNSLEPPGVMTYHIEPGVTLEKFIKQVSERVSQTRSPHERLGQAVFNYTERTFGEVARQVQFEDRIDCFYNDDAIADFLCAVYDRLSKGGF